MFDEYYMMSPIDFAEAVALLMDGGRLRMHGQIYMSKWVKPLLSNLCLFIC